MSTCEKSRIQERIQELNEIALGYAEKKLKGIPKEQEEATKAVLKVGITEIMKKQCVTEAFEEIRTNERYYLLRSALVALKNFVES